MRDAKMPREALLSHRTKIKRCRSKRNSAQQFQMSTMEIHPGLIRHIAPQYPQGFARPVRLARAVGFGTLSTAKPILPPILVSGVDMSKLLSVRVRSDREKCRGADASGCMSLINGADLRRRFINRPLESASRLRQTA